jgi:protein TonB
MKMMSLLALIFVSTTLRSQDSESFYVFNADWKPTKMDSAHFFLRVHKINDSCWQWDYYNFSGPLIKSERFRDKDGEQLDGVSYHYDESGRLDSTSVYKLGKKNGEFYKIVGDTFHFRLKYVYRDDTLVETVDLDTLKKNKPVEYKDERESEYPGGTSGWSRYLSKNLKYPDRAINANKEGDVRIFFIVDAEGHVKEAYIGRSVEYSLDETALKIIRDSGKWNPAFQNGRYVKSYKLQPIRFRLK